MLEIKLYVGLLASLFIYDIPATNPYDYVIKLVPCILISGFTLHKWIKFIRDNRKNKNNE